MRIVSGFCIREVMDEIVAIPTGEAAQKFSGIISLNPVSQLLFEHLNEEQTLESLVAGLMAEYEVDEKTASEDVLEFVNVLRENKLLVE